MLESPAVLVFEQLSDCALAFIDDHALLLQYLCVVLRRSSQVVGLASGQAGCRKSVG